MSLKLRQQNHRPGALDHHAHARPQAEDMGACMSVMVQGAGTMILLPQFKTHDVLQALSKHRATLFPGVPSMYVALNNSPELPTVDLTSLRHCFCGAAPLPREVQECFEAHIGGRAVASHGITS